MQKRRDTNIGQWCAPDYGLMFKIIAHTKCYWQKKPMRFIQCMARGTTRVPLACTSSELWPTFTLAPVTDFKVNANLILVCLFVVFLRLIEVTGYRQCVKQTY